MKSVLAALVILSLVMLGCDSNDENTVNSIPKYHFVYPVFHLEIDNNYQTFGVSDVMLKVSPSIGSLNSLQLYSDILVIDTLEIYPGTDSTDTVFDTLMSPAWIDVNGYLGTLDYGTWITDIDTIINTDTLTGLLDTTVDTSSVVFGFEPSKTYTFTFERETPFIWIDSFKAVYAVTIDSFWMVGESTVDTVSIIADPAVDPVTLLDSIAVIDDPDDTIGNQPDSVYVQEMTYGYWDDLDTALILIDSDLLTYAPDSTFTESVLWGFWNRVDTTFIPSEEYFWCEVDSIDTIIEVEEDLNGEFLYIMTFDTAYTNCDTYLDSVQIVQRRYKEWGAYDTTVHFIFPDTLKDLIIEPNSITIYNNVSAETNTASVNMTSMFGTAVQSVIALDSLTFQLTMPPEERHPDYRIIIKDE